MDNSQLFNDFGMNPVQQDVIDSVNQTAWNQCIPKMIYRIRFVIQSVICYLLISVFFCAVIENKGNKRRKISYDFVGAIDQTGGLLRIGCIFVCIFIKVISGSLKGEVEMFF